MRPRRGAQPASLAAGCVGLLPWSSVVQNLRQSVRLWCRLCVWCGVVVVRMCLGCGAWLRRRQPSVMYVHQL